jgi:GT2 family glycosyltransferase
MDRPDPRVSVVMITHNRREEVLRSLGYLIRLPERPHIVVVDNGSMDGTAAILTARYPQVHVLTPGRNLGAAGRTLGVRHVHTPYVALADDDTWWKAGSLRQGADLLDAHPKLAVITAQVLIGPEARPDPACAAMEHSPLPADTNLPGRPILGFLAGASLVRRSAFLEAGGFPERLFIGGEEEWLAVELAGRGWKLAYVPDLVVHHYPSARRDIGGRQFQLIRNSLWFAWLRRPLPSALRQTLHMLRSRPWNKALLRGFAAALAGMPWLFHERRVVPPDVESWLRVLDPFR